MLAFSLYALDLLFLVLLSPLPSNCVVSAHSSRLDDLASRPPNFTPKFVHVFLDTESTGK